MTKEESPKSGSSNPWDAIGGILVVNLDQRPERWQRMRNTTTGLVPTEKLQRFSAVLGKDLPGFGREPWFCGKPSDSRWGARAGCSLSHRGILQLAKTNDWENILVIEDDADFSNVTKEELSTILEYIFENSQSWDVFYLGYSKATGPALQMDAVGDHGVYQVSGCATTHAYLVNAKARDWILANLPDESGIWPWLSKHRAIDRWYSRHLSRHLSVLAISPGLIPQFGGFSDIVQQQVDYVAEFPGAVTNPYRNHATYTMARIAWRFSQMLSSVHDSIRAARKRRNGF